jgi:DNA mismatch repair protein MutL
VNYLGKIIVLDENTSNKIAAGEVIERPASVVKELVENSIDSGADSITVEIRNGGITYIKVVDNGSGISKDDAVIAFERHATSKIKYPDDLDSISSMGFRGEALSSIAAVSSVHLVSRTQDEIQGIFVDVKGGQAQEVRPAGCPVGTTITVSDLFYNTPARYKFLKKDTTEAGYVSEIVNRIALGNPHIAFTLVNNGKIVLRTPGNKDLLSTIYSVYGENVSRNLLEVNYSDDVMTTCGYVGKPEIARSNRSYQSFYVNNRYIKNGTITAALDSAYNTFLMKHKYAFAVLDIRINPSFIDVNVHPAKTEVKFADEQKLFNTVYNAVYSALINNLQIKVVDPEKNAGYTYNIERSNSAVTTENRQIQISGGSITTNSSADDRLYNDSENTVKGTSQFKEPENIVDSENVDGGNVDSGNIVNDDNVELITDYKYIGQIFSTYIVLQQNDWMILIDQHAAHERILYEELKDSYKESNIPSQMLISGIIVDVTRQEKILLDDERELFESLGFSYENFGGNSIILRSVPSNTQENAKALFLDLIDYLLSNVKKDRMAAIDASLFRIACKSAIKANKKLDITEVHRLTNELGKIANPFTCPHGRPSMFKISKYDIEKLFKRIV